MSDLPSTAYTLANARQGRQAPAGLYRPIRHEIIQSTRRAAAAAGQHLGPSAHRVRRSIRRPRMSDIAADRDLLFALLALQNGLIDQAQLVAAEPFNRLK